MKSLRHLVFDTNVCGTIQNSPNRKAVLKVLRSRYTFAASLYTIFELILALCRSKNSEYFESDRDRMKVMIGDGTIASSKFLDHGLSFSLKSGPGIETKESGTGAGAGKQLFELAAKAGSLEELKETGVQVLGFPKKRVLRCNDIESDFDNAKRMYKVDVTSALPSRTEWAKKLGSIVGVTMSEGQANALGDVLDGLYAYETWLRNAMRSRFNPDNNLNDRIDMHQLFYLADDRVEIVTGETKIRKRIETSGQVHRVISLDDLLRREGLSL